MSFFLSDVNKNSSGDLLSFNTVCLRFGDSKSRGQARGVKESDPEFSHLKYFYG
jgi:hypothetical protein